MKHWGEGGDRASQDKREILGGISGGGYKTPRKRSEGIGTILRREDPIVRSQVRNLGDGPRHRVERVSNYHTVARLLN